MKTLKTSILLFALIGALLFGSVQSRANNNIPIRVALAIAKKQFKGVDADYFMISDRNISYWSIFVDAEPMKGWEHDCYILKIPRLITVPIDSVRPITFKYRLPPNATFSAL
jgi:hypothetical protein